MLKRVLGETGRGGMCTAVVAQLGSQPLRLHRAWDAQRNNAVGAWWSFWWPSGTKDAFRAGYAVCPEWSALNRVISCTLKPGSTIVVGTTQSTDCANVTLPATATLQVFLAHPDRDLDLESCHAYAWE